MTDESQTISKSQLLFMCFFHMYHTLLLYEPAVIYKQPVKVQLNLNLFLGVSEWVNSFFLYPVTRRQF